MKNRYFFSAVLLFVIFMGILYVYQNKTQSLKTISPTPTPIVSTISTSPVLGIASDSSKCHAIWVNQDDPQAYLPDPNCTPGVIDPAVTQENLETTICLPGYTKTVRPPTSYTNALKKQQIIDYGYTDTSMANYEEDHLISLELGGSPKDPQNLWPEPHPSYNEKDKVENYLHSQVCDGKMTLEEAQQKIEKDWYEVFKNID